MIFINGNFPNNYSVAAPIVTRQTHYVNRYYVTEQPHICEVETVYVNHYIKKHKYYNRPICREQNVFTEENNGCCPGVNFNQ